MGESSNQSFSSSLPQSRRVEHGSFLSEGDKNNNAATGLSAAGARAIGSQAVAFYFRAPVKAFFRTRVDYLAFARAINPRVQAQEGWSLRMSTPGLLTHAVRTYGWAFIPNHVLPPMLANIGVGAILYTSYLQILGASHYPSSQSLKRVYPPPPIYATFSAGLTAGAIQSVIAAPLDAISVRFRTSEILKGRYKTMWHYGRSKLREIGPRGIFAGWSLNLIKDSLGYGAFFATFEYIKAQAYYGFVTTYYGDLGAHPLLPILKPKVDESGPTDLIKPHYAIEPTFLMLAGIAASICQQIIQHPLSLIQSIHYRSLEHLDTQAKVDQSKAAMLRTYYVAYEKTYKHCLANARRSGGWCRWLYKGFFMNTVKQVPSTSAGLVVFELVRRRYGFDAEAVRIEKDGCWGKIPTRYDYLYTVHLKPEISGLVSGPEEPYQRHCSFLVMYYLFSPAGLQMHVPVEVVAWRLSKKGLIKEGSKQQCMLYRRLESTSRTGCGTTLIKIFTDI